MGDDQSPVHNSKTKLADALKDAALANLSEDLKDIFNTIDKIANDLPALAKEQVADLKLEIESLNHALKAVPDEFGLSFEKKMNRILDAASEIEDHTKKYQKSLIVDLRALLDTYIVDINKKLSSSINNSFIFKDTTFYFVVFFISIVGGLVGSLGVCALFYYFIV